MSAVNTAGLLAAGSLNAADVLAATLARIDAEDGALGAFTALLDLPAALSQLNRMQLSGKIGPLQGLLLRQQPNPLKSRRACGLGRSGSAFWWGLKKQIRWYWFCPSPARQPSVSRR